MLGYCVKISKIHTLTNAFNPKFQFQCRDKLTSKHELENYPENEKNFHKHVT